MAKKYGGNKEDVGFEIELTSDSGFIMSGLTYSFGPGVSNNYLIRTDKLGDTIWTKTYGIVNRANGGCLASPTKTGGYIMFGLWDTISSNDNGGTSYIAKLDSIGTIKWMVFFNDSTTIDKIRELENGDIIAVGQKDKPPSQGYFYGGYVSELDSNGNQLWEKLLLYNGPGPYPGAIPYVSGVFYNFQTIKDNGFALTGDANYNTDSVTQINGIWLVKTDSMGCVESYCGIEGIEEVNKPLTNIELKIYPNPAYNTATIEWSLNSSEENVLAIYDLLGRRVFNEKVNAISGKTQVDVTGLQNGLYVVKLQQANGVTLGNRLVIMR